MDIVLIVGGVVLVLVVLFFWSLLRMARDPDPPRARDPYLAHLQARQIQGQRRGEAGDGSTCHPPTSRSRWEGGHDDAS